MDSQGWILKGWILNCRRPAGPPAGRRRGSQGAPGRDLGQAVGRRQLRIHALRIHPLGISMQYKPNPHPINSDPNPIETHIMKACSYRTHCSSCLNLNSPREAWEVPARPSVHKLRITRKRYNPNAPLTRQQHTAKYLFVLPVSSTF